LNAPGSVRLHWQAPSGTPPWRHVVLHLRREGRWETVHLPATSAHHPVLHAEADRAVVRAVGRTGLSSDAVTILQNAGAWSLPTPDIDQGTPARGKT
jgi:hypothetical protein